MAPELTVYELPPCDQYTVQGDAFSRAVREGLPAPTPPEDALGNMGVIEQILATPRRDARRLGVAAADRPELCRRCELTRSLAQSFVRADRLASDYRSRAGSDRR